MKSENKTKGYKMSKYLTVSFLFVASLMPNFLHANGQGVNGPNLSGESIPVQMDRLIELKDIEKVYKTCLSELTLDIISQTEGRKCSIDSSETKSELVITDGFGNYGFRLKYLCNSEKKNIDILSLISGQYVYFPTPSGTADSAIGKDTTVFRISKHELKVPDTDKTLPYFTFSSHKTDFVYGDFGEVINYKTVLKHLKIHNNSNSGHFFLVNKETNAPSKIMVNTQNFYLCMQSLRVN